MAKEPIRTTVTTYINEVSLNVWTTKSYKAEKDMNFGYIEIGGNADSNKNCTWDNLDFFIDIKRKAFMKECGEELDEKSSAFDTYIQIIDGVAEIIISSKIYKLKLGEGIIIPAHSKHQFNANEQFKMISTVIKNGYEE